MRKDPHRIYCFDKVTTVSEYLKEMHRTITEIKTIDCMMFVADSETEKAWVFDWQTTYKNKKCSRPFYYAPKSQCKVLINDYYHYENGKMVTDKKFILMPLWVANGIGY